MIILGTTNISAYITSHSIITETKALLVFFIVARQSNDIGLKETHSTIEKKTATTERS